MKKTIACKRAQLTEPQSHRIPRGIVGQMGLAVLKGRKFGKQIQDAKKTQDRDLFFDGAHQNLDATFPQPGMRHLIHAAFFHGCSDELGVTSHNGLVRQANSHKAAIYAQQQLMLAYWLIRSSDSKQFEKHLLPHMDGMAQAEWIRACIGARAATKVASACHQAGFTVFLPRAYEDMTFKIDLIALHPDDSLHGLCVQIKSASREPHHCSVLCQNLSIEEALQQSKADIAFAERVQHMRNNFPQNTFTPVKINVGKKAMKLPGKDINQELSHCPTSILEDIERRKIS